MKFSRVFSGGLATLTIVLSTEALSQTPREWTSPEVQQILSKTQTTQLAPDLSHLGPGERAALSRLLEVGTIFQDIYESQKHQSAIEARTALMRRRDALAPQLLKLYRLNQGPVAVTLDNQRVPFMAVEAPPPGKNVYPWDLTKAEIDAFIAAHPAQKADLTHARSVVRRADRATLAKDSAKLRQYPVLDTLHPGLAERLRRLSVKPDRSILYAAPYSLAYADQLIRAHRLLNEAAASVEATDWEFAKYLHNRARDLLSDDYESGDAAWLKGRFKNLNAQIGAYESYDDELYGVRAFFSMSLLAARNEEGASLRKAMQNIQSLEDMLPAQRHKKVQEDIPVGVYDVIADFGQARGGNTATNLPNEPYLAERYGSIILLRTNIMRDPNVFQGSGDIFGAAIAPTFAKHLTADSNFYRTLWHEVGHYLGPDVTLDGRSLEAAFGPDASLIEEMKADLVSLFLAKELHRRGYYNDDQLRALYASGVLRMLQNNKPRREQPYNMMQLMQWNWFLDQGVMKFDPTTAKMSIDYTRYHAAVAELLKQVIGLQETGDRAAATMFIDRWSRWNPEIHGRVSENVRRAQKFRFRLFEYAAVKAK